VDAGELLLQRSPFHFAEDDGNTLFMDGNSGYIGWLNTRVLTKRATKKRPKAGAPRTPTSMATANSIPKWTDSSQTYDSSVNPVDGSVWFAVDSFPGMIVRVDRGSHPPETCRTELFTPRWAGQCGRR